MYNLLIYSRVIYFMHANYYFTQRRQGAKTRAGKSTLKAQSHCFAMFFRVLSFAACVKLNIILKPIPPTAFYSPSNSRS